MLAAYCDVRPRRRTAAGARRRFYVAPLLAALCSLALARAVRGGLLRRVYRAPELYQLLLTFALVLVVGPTPVTLHLGRGQQDRVPGAGPRGSVPLFGQLFPTYDLRDDRLPGPLVALGLWLVFYRRAGAS